MEPNTDLQQLEDKLTALVRKMFIEDAIECKPYAWPARTDGKSVMEKAIKRASNDFEDEDSNEDIAYSLYKYLSGIKNIDLEHKRIFKEIQTLDPKTGTKRTCKDRMVDVIADYVNHGKDVDEALINNLLIFINDAAAEHYRLTIRKRGTSGNILLYINYILTERVIRIFLGREADGTRRIEVPSPIGNYTLTEAECRKNGLSDVLDFLDAILDRDQMEKTFQKWFYERMHRIGLWNIDAAGNTTYMAPELTAYKEKMFYLIEEKLGSGTHLAIDMVLGRATLSNILVMFHNRKNSFLGEEGDNSNSRGPGVWTGEYVLKDLAKNHKNGTLHPILNNLGFESAVEYYLSNLLEEVQHSIVPLGKSHGKLAITNPETHETNLGQVVEHDYTTLADASFNFMIALEKDHGVADGESLDQILQDIIKYKQQQDGGDDMNMFDVIIETAALK